MQYEVKEVEEKWQLDGIVDVLWAAMDGIEPSHDIFFPTFGTTPQDKERAISESKERLWKGHNLDPSSHWIYVVEGEGEAEHQCIVGGCQWRIYTENPFPDPNARINATFWPEGAAREFASEVASQCHAQRKAWMATPHAGITLMCVLPEKQRQGVGHKLMEWGVEQMDSRNLEGFVEASVSGRMLYRNFGFIEVAKMRVNMDLEDLDRTDSWRELEKKHLPIGYSAMWRPCKDSLPAAQTWEQKFKVPVRAHIEKLI